MSIVPSPSCARAIEATEDGAPSLTTTLRGRRGGRVGGSAVSQHSLSAVSQHSLSAASAAARLASTRSRRGDCV